MRPSDIGDISFEERDKEIFLIPDLKTRLDTLQNYFFPRLESLLRVTMDFISEVYGLNPYERMTFIYRPSHRKDAKKNVDLGHVHIGLSGKRRTDRPLTVTRPDGSHYCFHTSHLTYQVYPFGALYAVFEPYLLNVNSGFIEALSSEFRWNAGKLAPIFSIASISYSTACKFARFGDALCEVEGLSKYKVALFSFPRHFPLDRNRGLFSLSLAFVALYPLLEASVSIGEGEPPRLRQMLDRFEEWFLVASPEWSRDYDNESGEEPGIELPELDSYTFTRPGLWWEVLARDQWTCRSCGRSTKRDGIVLHVDHILPRSRGGADVEDNLQTLCQKCNLGKSNRDDTDLR